jgi:hypothetical protein
MVNNAHSLEVDVGVDGPSSAPLSGAAAAALLAGASRFLPLALEVTGEVD